uniref:HEAT repeat domain-containing protein n=1 Tax=Desulfobacca acetoxidans TaxID=60893 RepID=A0A7C3UWL0_9BACT
MATPIDEVHRLICELESLRRGEETVAALVVLGPVALEPLRRFLLAGKPSQIFQPRLGAVKALARLGARDALIAYLLQEREIADPEESFGEEAVASAAARSLAAWPDEDTRRFLLGLSERRLLNGVIDALAEFKTPEAIPYFDRALEDDFYRPAAENAFLKLGVMAGDSLSQSAVTPKPNPSMETPASLERRRAAVRLLNTLGISAAHWQILRSLLHESDAELVVETSKLGLRHGSDEDRGMMAQRLMELISSASWHLRKDIEENLVALKREVAGQIEEEIVQRLEQSEEVRTHDVRLRVLLRVKRRWERAGPLLPSRE